ncbi:hypothetical protein V865_008590 [Kwoniella europaea PYCC6329]|uniref:Uncharacterized protein n=1 Tax=Kwoniella europaea PYCC6329 TaxID=1423913 RepID=A0AAX4KWG2_9TREE
MTFSGFTIPVHHGGTDVLSTSEGKQRVFDGLSSLQRDFPNRSRQYDQLAEFLTFINSRYKDSEKRYAHFLVYENGGSESLHDQDCQELSCLGHPDHDLFLEYQEDQSQAQAKSVKENVKVECNSAEDIWADNAISSDMITSIVERDPSFCSRIIYDNNGKSQNQKISSYV